MPLLLLLLALSALPAAAQVPGDAYRDSGARALVVAARFRLATVDRAIDRYRVGVRERISAGLRVVGSERLLYRRESAARIDWSDGDTVRIQVSGARELVPPVLRGPQVPANLEAYVAHLAFDPADRDLLMPLDSAALVHPLGADAERHYRFATGDTTILRLPDGRAIRLVELRVTPRRADPSLITGSLWFDDVTADLVRMIFRPAADRPIGGGLLTLEARAALDRVTIEYALWDGTWWLPRLVWAEGFLELGGFTRVPLSYERAYADYRIEGDTARARTPSDSVPRDACTPGFRMAVMVGGSRPQRERRDAPRRLVVRTRCDRVYTVETPTDAQLTGSTDLPPSLWADGPVLTTAQERRAAAGVLLPAPPWTLGTPRIAMPIGAFRYNRVEAFSPAFEVGLDFGPAALRTRLRMGTGDRRLRGEVALERRIADGSVAVRAYRRLEAIEPALRPFSISGSIGAFVFGNDDGDYYATRGVELALLRRPATGAGLDARLFVERQRRVTASTDFSLRHLLNEAHTFRPVLPASPARQVGIATRLDVAHGLDPSALEWAAVLDVEAATGTFDYVRPSLLGRVGFPAGGLVGMLEAAGGVAVGNPPVQREWLVGGLPFVRGYDAAQLGGNAFWRARGEIGLRGPALRVVAFTDWGWAGDRSALGRGKPLASAGVGLTTLDGLLRFDVARAFRAPVGWAAHFRFNAPI